MRWYVWLNRLIYCLGILVLVVGSVLGGFFGLIWALFTGCTEGVTQTVPSPTGEFAALRVVRGCGGAAGSVQIFVRIRRVSEPSVEDETILQAPSHDFSFTMAWLDATTRAIDYSFTPGYPRWVSFQPPARDVVLTLRPYRREDAAQPAPSTGE